LHPDEYLSADPRRASALPATVFREGHENRAFSHATLAEIILVAALSALEEIREREKKPPFRGDRCAYTQNSGSSTRNGTERRTYRDRAYDIAEKPENLLAESAARGGSFRNRNPTGRIPRYARRPCNELPVSPTCRSDRFPRGTRDGRLRSIKLTVCAPRIAPDCASFVQFSFDCGSSVDPRAGRVRVFLPGNRLRRKVPRTKDEGRVVISDLAISRCQIAK
jgi:hypothetical protein